MAHLVKQKITNQYIIFISYNSYEVSDKDTEVFNALTEGPNEAAFPHAARWYKHIAEVKGLATK